jgi:histidine triad (HIT) family protein
MSGPVSGAPAFDPACLFCRIAAGQLHAELMFEDELVVAFPDIAPRAPTHILLLPRRHIVSAAALTEAESPIIGRLFAVAATIAREAGIAEAGYRMVTNSGRAAGQTVDHLHFHLMGGRPMSWPPG